MKNLRYLLFFVIFHCGTLVHGEFVVHISEIDVQKHPYLSAYRESRVKIYALKKEIMSLLSNINDKSSAAETVDKLKAAHDKLKKAVRSSVSERYKLFNYPDGKELVESYEKWVEEEDMTFFDEISMQQRRIVRLRLDEDKRAGKILVLLYWLKQDAALWESCKTRM